MKNFLSGKGITIASVLLVIVGLIGIIAVIVHFLFAFLIPMGQSISPIKATSEGTYSVDGGDWETIKEDTIVPERFNNLTCKWKIPEYSYLMYSNLNISSENVWYELKDSNGNIIAEHKYHSKEDLLDQYYNEYVAMNNSVEGMPEASTNPMLDREYFDANYPIGDSADMYMPNTPGYSTMIVQLDYLQSIGITEESELTLTIDNPYKDRPLHLSDCFLLTLSGDNGYYIMFFYEVLPLLILFSLVCFIGIFLFPIAGFILGKIDYRYLTFGLLCFMWGIYTIVNSMSKYMNLWLFESSLCVAIVIMLKFFFFATIQFYFKSNLRNEVTRIIANITSTIYIITIIVSIVLHFTYVVDLYASSINLYILTTICTLSPVILLLVETRWQDITTRRQTLQIVIAWIPLSLALIIDAVNHYMYFTTIHFYNYGLTITLLYQIIRMVIDLRKQYLEAIRYQQIQKELYEAKVNVMVSQIQPHFMYNALTSIAMMCTIEPETAKEATITFAKYLRGNMDSLKQTAPVSFTIELEHLKKYLYIEKLRFQDKLNVEYDITVDSFVLPLLSIQPLAENAVKHGVGMKKGGGTITIATRETSDSYLVIISDDGVGFDTENVKKDDGRSHVGMDNTRQRIKEMCGGEITIDSTIGEGTTATIILPKEFQSIETEAQHENTMS